MSKKDDNAVSTTGGGSNSQKLILGYIEELCKAHDEMDRVCQPHEEHINDILEQAKLNGVDTDALKDTVKFKRATEAKRIKLQKKAQNTETYLSLLQLSLF